MKRLLPASRRPTLLSKMCVLSRPVCPALCDPMDPARLLCPRGFSGKNTGAVCHALLQEGEIGTGDYPSAFAYRALLFNRSLRQEETDFPWPYLSLSEEGTDKTAGSLRKRACFPLPQRVPHKQEIGAEHTNAQTYSVHLLTKEHTFFLFQNCYHHCQQ